METRLISLRVAEWRGVVKAVSCLDIEQSATLTLDDYRGLACQLLPWITVDDMDRLRRSRTPTEDILAVWKRHEPDSATLDRLIRELKALKRFDVVKRLEDYVLPMFNTKQQHTREIPRGDSALKCNFKADLQSEVGRPPGVADIASYSTRWELPKWHVETLGSCPGHVLLPVDQSQDSFLVHTDPVAKQADRGGTGVADPRQEMLQMFSNMAQRGSTRLDDQMCFFVAMFIVAMWGMAGTIHRIMRSRFYDPIDRSKWSVLFYVLSYGKECSVYALLLSTAYCILKPRIFLQQHMVGSWLFTHSYLTLMILVQICQDKTVSPVAVEMRAHYLHFLRLKNEKCTKDEALDWFRWETESRQQRCQAILRIFLSAQFILLLGFYFHTDFMDDMSNEILISYRVTTVQSGVIFWWAAGLLAKVLVYIRHYRRPRLEILEGRFDISDNGTSSYRERVLHV